MKKRALFLIPVLIGSLVGCKQAGLSKVDADIRRTKNLKFDTKYAQKATTPTELDVYNEVYSALVEKGLTTKGVTVTYDERTYADEHIAETTAIHRVYTLYKDYAIKHEYTGKREILDTETNKVTRTKSVRETKSYYDDDREIYFTYQNQNGSQTITDVNLSTLDSTHIQNYITASVLDAYENGIGNLGWCNFYEKKNGYIGFYEDVDESEEGNYKTCTQVIYEFDKSFKITKATYLEEYYETYDYTKGRETKKLRCVKYLHDIREVTYGNRKPESAISSEIQKSYSKPFIDSGDLFYENLSRYDYTDFRYKLISPKKIHIEGFIYFNEFSSLAIDITPVIEVYTRDSMYDGYHLFQLDGKLSIKSSNYIKYYKGALQYQMNRFTDAIWFKIDCVLNSKNQPQFKSGSVEVKNRAELEAYMDSLYWY